MNRRMKVAGVVLGLIMGLAGGCAQERDPINRVQPNAFKKSFFLGEDLKDSSDDPEFYMRTYAANSSYDQPTYWFGTGSGIDRVRFEISEDKLIVRRAFQYSRGRDDKGVPGGEVNGTVVAVYAIESHFDIKKAYNPVTGEDMNVTEENTTDRPWYDREYIRVDWSTDRVANPVYQDAMLDQYWGNFRTTAMTYQVTDPTSEDAPYFDEDDGYLEITNRVFVEPQTVDTPWGPVPFCAYYELFWSQDRKSNNNNINDCNPQAATLRLAFWKIDPERDFESFVNTTAPEDVFSNFGSLGGGIYAQYGSPVEDYDAKYGQVDSGYHVLMHLINIWEKSHTDIPCFSDVDANRDGTDDECAAPYSSKYGGTKGSRCDTFVSWKPHEIRAKVAGNIDYNKAGKCTIPYRDRKVKTQAWWLNKEMYELYQDKVDANGNRINSERGPSEDVVYSWNQLLMSSVAMARSAECRRTGDVGCHERYFAGGRSDPYNKELVSYGGWLIDSPKDRKDVFIVCHNPVRAYDNQDVCGPTGTKARTGDLRKHWLLNWPATVNYPFLGIGHLNVDPTTGETIGNTATVVEMPYAANMMLQTLLVEMGDLTLEDYIGGGSSREFLNVKKGQQSMGMTAEQIEKVSRTFNGQSLRQSASPALRAEMRRYSSPVEAMIADKADLKYTAELLPSQVLASHFALEPFRNTSIEYDLIDADWLRAAQVDQNSTVTDSVLELASPLRGMDPVKLHYVQQDIERRLAKRGACFTKDQVMATMGQVDNAPLAKYYLKTLGSYGRDERIAKIREELEIETYKQIMTHEMGHALGMRHQFTSSYDAMNYQPQYWQLRTNRGDPISTQSCKGVPRQSLDDTCMGPRYLDPHTDDELGITEEEPRPAIEFFGNTSTMEYTGEYFSASSGLGTYDYSWMKAVYGRVLETYDSEILPRLSTSPTAPSQHSVAPRMYTHLTGDDLVYTQWRIENPFDPSWQTPSGTGATITTLHYTALARHIGVFDEGRDCRGASPEEIATAKWRIVHGMACQPYPRDYAVWDDFLSDNFREWYGGGAPFTKWHTQPAPAEGQTTESGLAVVIQPEQPYDVVRWSYKIGEMYYPSYTHANPRDSGADSYEVTFNEIKHFNANYPVRYFRRNNLEYNAGGIASRSSGIFERLRSYHWSFARDLMRYSLLNEQTGLPYYELFAGDDNSARPGLMANALVFDSLFNWILVPQPGYNGVRPGDLSGAYTAVDGLTADTADFKINIIDGRYVDTAYDYNKGGSWEIVDWETRAGFSIEKAYAMAALADSRPTLSTIARESYLDQRDNMLNFRNDQPEAIDRLFGGLLSEDWQSIGMWIDPSEIVNAPGTAEHKTARPRLFSLTELEDRPAGAKVLFPNIGYSQQRFGALLAALYAPGNSDMTLIHKMRIWVDGMEGFTPEAAFPNEDEQVRFFNPASGFTYIARRFGTEMIDGREVEKGIASRMLQRANQLVVASYVVQTDSNGEAVLDKFGMPILVLDADGLPVPIDPFLSMAGELNRYVGLIDGIRKIGQIFGSGPHDGFWYPG